MSRNPGGGEGLARAHAYLADLRHGRGRPYDALGRLRSFLESQQYPLEHRVVLQPALLSAARAELAAAELGAAHAYGSDALEIAERSARGVESSADVGDALVILARIEVAAHRAIEGRPLLERAIRCYHNSLGNEAPLTTETRQVFEDLGT